MKKFIFLLVFLFFILLIRKSFGNITSIPLHDFDEANRAEGAKNMKIYNFFLSPITGSPFLRHDKLKISAKQNPQLNLYYHLERPPLVFWSMILTISIFGESEWSYRLPSFLFGLLTIIIFYFYTKNVVATLILIFSKDWWLSSQYALLDTALSFFLFLAFVFLLEFNKKKNNLFLIFSGVSLGGAILAKGQPAIIFLFPLLFLLLSKKITIKHSAILLLVSFLIISPWLILSIKKFGLTAFVEVFFGFAKNRSLIQDTTQLAPFYWYARWWFESLRPAWVIFFSFLIYDFLRQKINFEKKLILFYFFFSFALFSFSKNKVWWYVLPLIPIVAIYTHYSVKSYLKENKNGLINLFLILFFTSLPIFHDQRNLIALILLCFYIFTSTVILHLKINLLPSQFFSKILISFLLLASMSFFYKSFPAPQPTFAEVKVIGDYYQKIPQPKCLYVESMPYEAALFYSNAEEINYYTDTKKLSKNCTNYLLTPKSKNYPLIFKKERLKLYKLTR